MTTDILNFHKVSADDANLLGSIEQNSHTEACDCIFASIFAWAQVYDTEIAFSGNTAVVRYVSEREKLYFYPLGGSAEERASCIRSLLDLAHAEDDVLKFTVLTEKDTEELERFFPGAFQVFDDRDHYDYIVSREKLAKFAPGSVAKSEVYNLRRFVKTEGWSYEPVTENNLSECLSMAEEWLRLRLSSDKLQSMTNRAEEEEELKDEFRVLSCSLNNWSLLGLSGGLLRMNGRVIAFLAGKMMNEDSFVFQYRKALPSYPGSSQALTQLFCQSLPESCRYINLEDDVGDPGLRQAKLYSHPERFIKKYYGIESRVTTASADDDFSSLWAEAFGDSPEYIEFYRKHKLPSAEMLVIRENGRIISMASFWPAALKLSGKDNTEKISQDVMYVYGVATAKEFRGRGLARQIISFAAYKYQLPLILVPADEQLREYYRSQGFEDWFSGADYSAKAGTEADVQILTELSAEEYKNAMERGRNGVILSWDEDSVKYAIDENAFSGGKIARIGNDYALYSAEENSVIITEYTGTDTERALAAIAASEQAESAAYKKEAGMILWNYAGINKEILRGYTNVYLTLSIE